jgi:hypothetical protein
MRKPFFYKPLLITIGDAEKTWHLVKEDAGPQPGDAPDCAIAFDHSAQLFSSPSIVQTIGI